MRLLIIKRPCIVWCSRCAMRVKQQRASNNQDKNSVNTEFRVKEETDG